MENKNLIILLEKLEFYLWDEFLHKTYKYIKYENGLKKTYYVNLPSNNFIVNIFIEDVVRIEKHFNFKNQEDVIEFLKEEFKFELRKIKIKKLLLIVV